MLSGAFGTDSTFSSVTYYGYRSTEVGAKDTHVYVHGYTYQNLPVIFKIEERMSEIRGLADAAQVCVLAYKFLRANSAQQNAGRMQAIRLPVAPC
jgi:hypothetical protein